MELPKEVQTVCKKLSNEGYKAYLAGGCVRDSLLKRAPKDWDVVTDAPVEKIKSLFSDHLEVGAAFGVIKLKNSNVDIAIFRKESDYSDSRHPDKVDAGDEATDTARRDFTINALYYDFRKQEIIDHVGGLADLELRMIRTVGNPKERFEEDALRILRAARFAAQLSFKIDSDTQTAMKSSSVKLKRISRERIREELFKMLESIKPLVGLEVMMKCALWEEVFAEKKTALPADFRSLKYSEKPTPLAWICALALTGLFGDPVKNHEKITKKITESLKLSNDEKKVLSRILSVFEESENPKTLPQDWFEMLESHRLDIEFAKRFIRRARGVTIEQKDLAEKFLDQAKRFALGEKKISSIPTAKNLIKEGFKEGPALGSELKIRQWKAFWGK